MPSSPEIRTPRLCLHRFAPAHAAALHALWNHPEVARFLWDGREVPLDLVAEQIAASQVDFAGRGFGRFALALRERPGALIGFAGLRDVPGFGDVELVFGLHPDQWRRGLATEAAEAVLRFGFAEVGLARIVAGAEHANEASLAVLRRLGMRPLGERQVGGVRASYFEAARRDR